MYKLLYHFFYKDGALLWCFCTRITPVCLKAREIMFPCTALVHALFNMLHVKLRVHALHQKAEQWGAE